MEGRTIMRRFCLAAVFCVLCPLSAFAQQTSVTYEPLTQSSEFLNRIAFQIVLAAPAIETEAQNYTPASGDTHPSTAVCHSARAALAANVAKNPSGYALIFAEHIVTSSAVTTAGALTGSLSAGTLDTPATDAALFSAVNAMWSDTAGCITTP
jgi:hypothetical protein